MNISRQKSQIGCFPPIIKFLNRVLAVTQIMGATSPDELIGKTDFDFYPQELATQYYAAEQEVIQSGQPQFNREEPVIMPEMDGLEAIRHIQLDKHGKSISIIALTALTMPGDREKCLAAGADEYFSKPVSLRGLSEAIEHFLSRKGWIGL